MLVWEWRSWCGTLGEVHKRFWLQLHNFSTMPFDVYGPYISQSPDNFAPDHHGHLTLEPEPQPAGTSLAEILKIAGTCEKTSPHGRLRRAGHGTHARTHGR